MDDSYFTPVRPRLNVYKSDIDCQSSTYRANYDRMSRLVEKLNDNLQEWQYSGSDKRIKMYRDSRKMLGRERLELLLDQDSPFLEIMPLSGHGTDAPQGNPMIIGIGLVAGTECMIVCNVPTIGRGAMSRESGMKWGRAAEIAWHNRIPHIQLLESSGADLTSAFDLFHAKPGPFHTLSVFAKAKIPTVAVVFGTCIAGGAYMAGMAQYTIMVKGNAQLALAGSRLVKVATSEEATDEELGGAEMHTLESGSCEWLANNEHQAILRCRELMSSLNCDKAVNFPGAFCEMHAGQEPLYDADELLGLVDTTQAHASFDAREVIARIVDGSAFFEFKPLNTTLVTVWAYIHGCPVGIVANNGIIFPKTGRKGAHFINLCCQRGVPIIYLHNVTGFMVGKQYEREGMLKWGSQMISAMSTATVPQISIIIGSSFGAANYAMCGRGYAPRFIFSWVNGKCHVMGSEQLSGVLELLAVDNARRAGKKVNKNKIEAARQFMKAKMDTEMDAFYYTGRAIDDGVIDPRDTRAVLGFCLSVCCTQKIEAAPGTGISRL